MKIKMTQTKTAASDLSGIRGMTYEAGKEYDIHEELAQVFIREGWAKKNKESKAPEETKDLKGSEENKEEALEVKEEPPKPDETKVEEPEVKEEPPKPEEKKDKEKK